MPGEAESLKGKIEKRDDKARYPESLANSSFLLRDDKFHVQRCFDRYKDSTEFDPKKNWKKITIRIE